MSFHAFLDGDATALLDQASVDGSIVPTRLADALFADPFVQMRAARLRLSRARLLTAMTAERHTDAAVRGCLQASRAELDRPLTPVDVFDSLVRNVGDSIAFDVTAVEAWLMRARAIADARREPVAQVHAASALKELLFPQLPTIEVHYETETWLRPEDLVGDAILGANVRALDELTLTTIADQLVHRIGWRRDFARVGFPLPRPATPAGPCDVSSSEAYIVFHDDGETTHEIVMTALREVLGQELSVAFRIAQGSTPREPIALVRCPPRRHTSGCTPSKPWRRRPTGPFGSRWSLRDSR